MRLKAKSTLYLLTLVLCFMLGYHSSGYNTLNPPKLHQQDRETNHFKDVGRQLTFIKPGSGLCSEFLLKSETEIEQDTKDLNGVLDAESRKWEFPVLRHTQWYLAQLPFVSTICGTGLNSISVKLWLTANYKAHVYIFDDGTHNLESAKQLQVQFPHRVNITWGDSKQTLATFITKHPHIQCDLIVVNGGHSYTTSKSDHTYFRRMASSSHIVLLDNHPNLRSRHGVTVGQAWEEQKKQGELYEFGRCTLSDLTSGFSIGQYVLT